MRHNLSWDDWTDENAQLPMTDPTYSGYIAWDPEWNWPFCGSTTWAFTNKSDIDDRLVIKDILHMFEGTCTTWSRPHRATDIPCHYGSQLTIMLKPMFGDSWRDALSRSALRMTHNDARRFSALDYLCNIMREWATCFVWAKCSKSSHNLTGLWISKLDVGIP